MNTCAPTTPSRSAQDYGTTPPHCPMCNRSAAECGDLRRPWIWENRSRDVPDATMVAPSTDEGFRVGNVFTD